MPAMPASAQPVSQDSLHVWQALFDQGEHEKAEALCGAWLDSERRIFRVEAHKCMANLLLSGASSIQIERTTRGGLLRDGLHPAAADSAAGHLDAAIALSPEDLSLHRGRLHILVHAGFYDRAHNALAESLRLKGDSTGAEVWLPYGAKMFHSEQHEASLHYMKTLSQFYPDDHRVVANIGAMLTILKRDNEALVYARRAVELSPDDPIDNWNLGRLYMYTDNPEKADESYQRALELAPDGVVDGKKMQCMYADFVADTLDEQKRADALRKEHCE